MRHLPPWNRPVLVGLMGFQTLCVLAAMWYGWGVQPIAQWITPALACLAVNMSLVAGLRRQADRSGL
jgi:hypothetical protein